MQSPLMLSFAAMVGIGAPGLGCYSPEPFTCEADEICVDDERVGACEIAVGYCSYPNSACPSGREYGPYAGEGQADTCVPVPEDAVADLAVCIGLGDRNGDPQSCAIENGSDIIDVDLLDSDTQRPNAAFLRFPLDAIARDAVGRGVVLELTAAAAEESGSNASGRIALAPPFDLSTLAELQSVEPEALAIVGVDQGPVEPTQIVQWNLQLDLPPDAEVLHLAVLAGSDDNVRYWNTASERPPRLVFAGP